MPSRLPLRRLGPDPAFGKAAVGDGAFDRFDGDRLVDDVERARSLAWRGADAAGHFREIVGRVQILGSRAAIGLVYDIVPVGDLVVVRAAGVTIGDAGIHAARGLKGEIGLARRN